MTKIKNAIKDNPIFLLIAAVLFSVFIAIIWGNLDNDFYHIVFSGKWIAENNAIQYENTAFVEEGYKTLVQQWLYSLLLHLCHSSLGIVGVQLFVTLQFLIQSVVMYKLLVLFNVDKRTSVLIVAVSMLVMGYINCRPQMISLILLYGQLYILEKYRKTGKKAILYLLPLLTLIHINVHCTFWVFHYVFILPYVVPLNRIVKAVFKKETAIEDTTINIKPLIIPIILMAASLFVNPYGIDAILCLFYTSNLSILGIKELNSIEFLSEHSAYIILSIIVCVVLYFKKRLTSTTAYITAGTSILLALAIRNVIFFSIAVAYVLKDAFKDFDTDKLYGYIQSGKFCNKLTNALSKGAVACLSVVLLFVALPSGVAALSIGKVKQYDNCLTPVGAVEYIKENETNLSNIRMFTCINSGSYFLYNGIGKVYIEPKSEPYIEKVNGVKDIIYEYASSAVNGGAEQVNALIDEYDFDYLYVPYFLPTIQIALEMSDDYECVYISDVTAEVVNNEVAAYMLYKHIS